MEEEEEEEEEEQEEKEKMHAVDKILAVKKINMAGALKFLVAWEGWQNDERRGRRGRTAGSRRATSLRTKSVMANHPRCHGSAEEANVRYSKSKRRLKPALRVHARSGRAWA